MDIYMTTAYSDKKTIPEATKLLSSENQNYETIDLSITLKQAYQKLHREIKRLPFWKKIPFLALSRPH